ncbi:VOC family protein [Ruegeria atlantica]|uniref:Methylmalonyl-CoA epimerase n=1 Tax=Ruegeria atlantica TaxID=81569 RepID=A0A0N7LQV4_9RHOB|nr:VOC family protein [Ruegeria atlantica]CUH49068.1 methylmalonyl-CoA epimerase [Ruegeria atlantica]
MNVMQNSLRLHHVGIVQPSMENAEDYMSRFGHIEDYRGYVEEFECWCLFCTAPENSTAVELVVPTGGSLARFNRGAGGLHHYAFETPDILTLQKELATRDVTMLRDTPVKGAGNFLCNFTNPISTRGILVEYVQPLDGSA